MNDFPYEEAAMPYSPDSSTESSSPVQHVKQRHEQELMAIDGVEGVGVGRNSVGGHGPRISTGPIADKSKPFA